MKRLQELPETVMLEMLRWYCKRVGLTTDVSEPTFKISFKLENAQLLKEFDEKVQRKIVDIKEAKKKAKKE